MKLTDKNYFSPEMSRKYFSVSQYKSFKQCEEMTMAELNGKHTREMTTALYIGSYVDAYFEGTLELFKKNNPEIFKKDGDLKKDYVNAEYIIERIEQQPLMMDLLSGEKQKIMTGEICGVPFKIKIDSLLDNMIVDLKAMKDFKPIYVEEQGRLPWFEAWGYDIQGAVYREIVRQNTGKTLPFVLVAATKEKPEPDFDVIEISPEMLDFQLDKVKEDIDYLNGVKAGIFEPERCEQCAFCRRTKTLTEIRKGSILDE